MPADPTTPERPLCGGSQRCGYHHAVVGVYRCCCGLKWINKSCQSGATAGEPAPERTPPGDTEPLTDEDRDRIGRERIAYIRAGCICNRAVPAVEFVPVPGCPIHGHVPPDDTTEGLRERLQHVILNARCDCLGRDGWACSSHRAAAVVEELSGRFVPGDLPARMEAAMRVALVTWSEGAQTEHLAKVALSVTQEHAASQAAEMERLRAERDAARADADAAADEVDRWRDHADRTCPLAAEVERLREIERVTTPPAEDLEMPTDPDELRELWEFVIRQSRWQYHMAHKFGGQVERLRAEVAKAQRAADDVGVQLVRRAKAAEAERDALTAAIEQAKALHAPIARPSRPDYDPTTERCRTCAAHADGRWRRFRAPCPTFAALDAPKTTEKPAPCPRCGGSMIEPGSEDYDPAVHMHNPTTGEPCGACGGTGNATGWLDQLAAGSLSAAREKFGPGFAPETTERPTPERRRDLLRDLTQQAIEAGTYGEPAPEMRPAPETPGDGEGQPGTYWERAVLERFVTGGQVDMQNVRQQVAALLAETPRSAHTSGDAEEATPDER